MAQMEKSSTFRNGSLITFIILNSVMEFSTFEFV